MNTPNQYLYRARKRAIYWGRMAMVLGFIGSLLATMLEPAFAAPAAAQNANLGPAAHQVKDINLTSGSDNSSWPENFHEAVSAHQITGHAGRAHHRNLITPAKNVQLPELACRSMLRNQPVIEL
jgi:hypothetical protein